MNNNSKLTVRLLTYSAIFASLIFVATAYLSIPLPVMGYVHLGDGLVLLTAALLPTPYALAAVVIGSSLADFITGFALYIPATAVIKALMTLCMSSKTPKVLCVRNLLGIVLAAVTCSGGYYIYDVIITKSFVVPLASLPLNLAQTFCGGIALVILGILIDKNHGIQKIFKQHLR